MRGVLPSGRATPLPPRGVERPVLLGASGAGDGGVLPGGASGLLDVDWVAALSVAGLATVGSLLTSVATPDFTAGGADPGADGLQAVPQAQTRDERLAREAQEHGG